MEAPRRYLPGLLLACYCLLLPSAASQPSQPPADEARLLLQIKRAWGDPPVLAGWNNAAGAHCSWPHVRCDAAGRVTKLTLANANVSGPFPDAVGGLAGLTHLDVSNNSIAGVFPTALYRCASLRYVDLSQNYFGGELPADIGRRLAATLSTLVLSGNEFNGTIPRSLSRLLNLRHLMLDYNRLVGTVPPELGALTRLSTLVLSGNGFNGTIPRSLSSLLNLRHLELDNNRLVGTVPAELGALTRLQTLWLAFNPFTAGELPASFKNLTSLVSLWAKDCNLVGDLPSYLVDMQELEMLDLSNNSLTGSIPPGIWSLKKLQTITIFRNNLTGDMVVDDGFAAKNLTIIDVSENSLSGVIPEVFGHLENLRQLHLFRNNFSGEIPASIGRLPSLWTLRLYSNRFTGTLPLELGKHSGLGYVEVDDNELTGAIPEGLCAGGQFHFFTAELNHLNGSIPASLANCTTLKTLALANNQLTGDVPEALWTGTQLQFLTLQSNQLTGSMPATMPANLTTLHIGNNQFGGKIPASAATLHLFTAENNQFSGAIPASLAMPLLQTLNLSGNQLSGAIPKSVASLRQLTFMDVSRNRLSGAIPAELGAMPVLSVLDLSSNELSGAIPPELVQPNLNTLNLSSNHLSGQVPTGFATAAYDNSFRDNPGLCTAAPGPGPGYLAGVRACAAAELQDRGSSRGVSHALRTGLLVAGAVALAAAAFALLLVRDIRQRRRVVVRDEWKMTPFVQGLGFGEASILRDLAEENLLGRGGSGHVYRVTYTHRLSGSAGTVAVKRIRIAGTLDETLQREFESEAAILGSVRHNNIVRLLCCISGTEAKLLVYDYMDNGSLDQWLHGQRHNASADGLLTASRAPLDWPKRLSVAIDVAQGLCYLHHECSPPIVHRDVKTSNILLDSELRAKVADFGLARMLVEVGAPKTMSAVAGSFGYMAPECAYTNKVNEKVDVYSFGVVLLELTTGKEASARGEHGCLAEWARHHYQSGGSIRDATDKSIRHAGYCEEILVVFRLGVLCTADMPSSRPTMKDVQQILLKCSETTHQKSKMQNGQEYEAAPLLLPQQRSRRKQPSNGTGIDIEENGDFDSTV